MNFNENVYCKPRNRFGVRAKNKTQNGKNTHSSL